MVDKVQLGGNRLATMLWYLESPSAGGETYFPCANDTHCIGGDDPEGYPVPSKCGHGIPSTGLKVPPTPGLAALFYSLRPDGARDGFSLHAGCPPEGSGSKWAVNKCESRTATSESCTAPHPEVAAVSAIQGSGISHGRPRHVASRSTCCLTTVTFSGSSTPRTTRSESIGCAFGSGLLLCACM